MSSFFHSIRWRVQAWHGLILLLVILAFCFTAYRMAWGYQFHRIDRSLTQADRTLFHVLMESSKTPPAPGSSPKDQSFSFGQLSERLQTGKVILPPENVAYFSSKDPGFAYFSMVDADGRVLFQSPNAPKDLSFPSTISTDLNGEQRSIGKRRELVRRSPDGVRSVVGVDVSPEIEEMNRFALSLSAVALGVWLLGLLGGWWLAGRAIKPISTISNTATRIAEGNLEERISTDGTDSELDQLSRVLNHTFDRLHRSFERQKQFTADASHELRTPVTILLSETQRILKRERTPEEYREVIQTCQATANRMRNLTEALLLLARQEAETGKVQYEHCELGEILGETISHYEALAAAHGIRLGAELPAVACLGDQASLSILAANLVSNAIEHNNPNGTVRIRCYFDHGLPSFSVADDGPGIQPEDLPHIFERFYRADKARTSTQGHSGLGLAIAKTIVDNHGGSIEVVSKPGQGASFSVRLPLGS